MDSNALVIAWANQKGGAGKSTVCRLVATHLWHANPGIRIMVWDCDNPQFTNARLRDMDLKIMEILSDVGRDKKIKAELAARLEKSPLYPIKQMDVYRIEQEGNQDLKTFDIIFIDLPGKIDSAELARVLSIIDFIFVPIDYDYATIDSTVRYLKVLLGFAHQHRFPFVDQIFLFFNKIEKNQLENSALPVAEDILNQGLGVKFLQQVILLRKNIKDDTLSTLVKLYEDGKVDNTHFYGFYNEFCNTIHRPEAIIPIPTSKMIQK